MKYNRIILSAVIALVMMLAPLPCFGETDVLQYTADPTNAESWQGCDSNQSVTFEQNKKIYLRFSAAESTESGTSSQEDSGTAPVLWQRSADTSKEILLQPDSEGLYLLNTDKIGSWEILYEDSVRMRFTVKEANAIQPPSEKPSKPKSKAGVLRKGKYYFYRDSKGKIRKKAGFVTWNGNKYYVRKGGRIQTGKTFKVGKFTYRANKKGQIKNRRIQMGKNLLLFQQQGAASEVQGLRHLEEEPLLYSKRREDSEEQVLPNRKVHLSGRFRRAHQGGRAQMGKVLLLLHFQRKTAEEGRPDYLEGKVLLQPKERHPVYQPFLF